MQNDALYGFKSNDPEAQTYWASETDLLYRPSNFDPLGMQVGEALPVRHERPINYADQILPFTVTIVGSNEVNGQPSSMRLWGVEILNEGTGTSTGDTSFETQMTFIARSVSPWRRAESQTSAT